VRRERRSQSESRAHRSSPRRYADEGRDKDDEEMSDGIKKMQALQKELEDGGKSWGGSKIHSMPKEGEKYRSSSSDSSLSEDEGYESAPEEFEERHPVSGSNSRVSSRASSIPRDMADRMVKEGKQKYKLQSQNFVNEVRKWLHMQDPEETVKSSTSADIKAHIMEMQDNLNTLSSFTQSLNKILKGRGGTDAKTSTALMLREVTSLHSTKAEIETLLNEDDDAIGLAHTALGNKISALLRDDKRWQAENERQNTELKRLKATITEKDKEIKDLKDAIKHFESLASGSTDDITKESAKLQAKLTEAQVSMNRQTTQIDDLRDQLDALNVTERECKAEVHKLKGELQQQKKEYQAQHSAKDSVEAKLMDSRSDISKLEKAKLKLETDVQQGKDEIKRLEVKSRQDSQKFHEEAHASNMKLRANDSEIRKLKEEVAQSTQEIMRLKGEVARHRQPRGSEPEAIRKLEDIIVKRDDDIQQLQLTNKSLQQKLDSRIIDNRGLEDDLRELKAAMRRIEDTDRPAQMSSSAFRRTSGRSSPAGSTSRRQSGNSTQRWSEGHSQMGEDYRDDQSSHNTGSYDKLSALHVMHVLAKLHMLTGKGCTDRVVNKFVKYLLRYIKEKEVDVSVIVQKLKLAGFPGDDLRTNLTLFLLS
jgi:DNA repair exonuclease SbcCD ATPase subunit